MGIHRKRAEGLWHAARMDLRNAFRPAWYVVSLRPRGDHAVLRGAAHARGAGLIELSPWTIQARDDATTRDALDAALDCDAVIATSIPAVRAAHALRPLDHARGRWIAVGRGTAQALAEAGVVDVDVPPVRMDSEGVLALPVLHDPDLRRVGLVTAPGGRDLLAATLRARGIEVVEADVYARIDIPLDPDALDRIRSLDVPAALAVSSVGALQRVIDGVDGSVRARLQTMQVLAASDRVAEQARAHGFIDIVVAASADPHALLAVARRPA